MNSKDNNICIANQENHVNPTKYKYYQQLIVTIRGTLLNTAMKSISRMLDTITMLTITLECIIDLFGMY